MCGIVGTASATTPVSAAELTRARDTMEHRGPDDAGVWVSEDLRVGLAHRRLSIIDLSPGGHQPMADDTGRLTVTFNGEIYNFRDLRGELESHGHRFRTSSDTEVILAAYRQWGSTCVEHLNGMFAFALHDAERDTLFLARDRAGEKPLFYRHAHGRLSFASELKALLCDPTLERRMDAEALDHYLAYGYVPQPLCLIQGVAKLPQAHTLTYSIAHDRAVVQSYWSLPDAPHARTARSAGALTAELESLLEDAVRRQLVADVPVGIMLSGGVDSSVITALATRVAPGQVRTFTISFPDYPAFDEAPYARRVATHLGTVHTELAAEPASVELLPLLARQFDEPLADSSMVPTYMVSRMIREHAKVALGGDGGDELFGGYPRHSWAQKMDTARRLVPAALLRTVAAVGSSLPSGVRGRNYLMGMAQDVAGGLARFNVYFDAGMRSHLAPAVLAGTGRGWDAPETRRAQSIGDASALQECTRMDFTTFMVDDILTKVDRASMLASLEVRAPFLDYRVIEFAFGRVPDALRATPSERKVLTRRLAARLLPGDLDLKRKQGFSLPLAQWLRGDWRSFVADVLHGAPRELLEPRVVNALITGHRRGLSNTHRIFALTMLELWRREYAVTVSV